jgi:ABC-2 type transport system permease protein
MFMLATMAFMISSVFRNSSLAIGISLVLMFTGGNITQLLALKFSWAKYILFANTNLMQYFEGTPMVEGMTITFSVVMILIYFIIFQVLAFGIFKKRDVAA